jgi:hypothetical protein
MQINALPQKQMSTHPFPSFLPSFVAHFFFPSFLNLLILPCFLVLSLLKGKVRTFGEGDRDSQPKVGVRDGGVLRYMGSGGGRKINHHYHVFIHACFAVLDERWVLDMKKFKNKERHSR